MQAPLAENVSMKEIEFTFTTSSSEAVLNQKPAKKPTRQWAAWTRQEEENFFNALRQVGKNFEKITCRVQSKNKDQVRHYYYRLVRRMNKLLGPGFYLDAKNSKDTNAAMLRWWSLLEKYSCTASKLHLKPRRFKIFVEALENQLLKDRNKTRRKRPQGDIYLPSPSTPILSKAPANDPQQVKLLAFGAQNSIKIGVTKEASFKRNVDLNTNFGKGDLHTMRTVKQKRRAGGIVASTAYRRWEKAARAGVSLVADAAEQLERASISQNCSFNSGTLNSLSNDMYSSNGICPHQIKETVIQPSVKLKLQLFPINEATRKALEKDAHNPHLELTLSARKRITSVLEHLNRKWCNSSIACGELVLFPYSIQQEDLASHQRWTMKDTVSAADVFVSVGSPAIFRLRYGWFSSTEIGADIPEVCSAALLVDNLMHTKALQIGCTMIDDLDTIKADPPALNHFSKEHFEQSDDQLASAVVPLTSFSCPTDTLIEVNSAECKDNLPESSTKTPSLIGEVEGQSTGKQEDNVVLLGAKCDSMSTRDWADSLTDISIGDLLAEASRAANSDCINSSSGRKAPCCEEVPLSCDSFDAAIAAHLSGHQSATMSTQISHSSIWSSEETCDEFSFRTIPAFKQEIVNPSTVKTNKASRHLVSTNSLGFQGFLEGFAGSVPAEDLEDEPLSVKDFSSENDSSAKDPYLTDIYWPDSLGPLDLETPSFRYQGQELVFGDSLGSLSRLMASSLDAFRNLSFFSMEKKES
ncbi:TSL-kinase interacting protein 1 [Typha latifolia]|uniref:TSL-kinase interacting protein 1 n=1 Tax=Typha latifolia TaxID=4733 RepID=UPI003C2B3AF3